MCRHPKRLDMPIWASKKWKLNVIETCQSLQLLSLLRGLIPYLGSAISASSSHEGECQEERPPIRLPPQPRRCCRPRALASLHSSTVRGERQCWAHGEIRADGWRGWPGGRDSSLGPTQQVCSGRRCSLLPPRPYLPPMLGKEVRTWPCVYYYKSVSTFLNGKSYLRKR